jgi:hypothetical protein
VKFFKKDTPLGLEQRNENRREKEDNFNRISKIRRNMTRGASNIFRVIKDRAKWGNKQLWGTREKGKPHLPIDKSSKHKH